MGSPMPWGLYCVWCCVPLLRPIEYVTVIFAIGFLLYQVIRARPKLFLGWVAFGSIVWIVVILLTGFTLRHLWQSVLFLALVLLNIAIAFHKRFYRKASVIFIDVTTCFLMSQVMLSRHYWRVAIDNNGHSYAAIQFRDDNAIVMNMVILAVIIAAYFGFNKLGMFKNNPNDAQPMT